MHSHFGTSTFRLRRLSALALCALALGATRLQAQEFPSQGRSELPPPSPVSPDELRAERIQYEMSAFGITLARGLVELEKQRRALAAAEQKELEAARARLMEVIESKKWALRSFDTTGTRFLPTMENQPDYMKRVVRAREVMREKFLKFKESSHAEIVSGKALNYFLDTCGATAAEHTAYREEISAERLKAEIELAQTVDISPPDSQSSKLLEQRLALLDMLDSSVRFTADDLKSVHVASGLVGPKIPMRLNDESLPLEWPEALRDDPLYRQYTDRVKLLKDQCVEALRKASKDAKTGGGIPFELRDQLKKATDDLCSKYQRDTTELYNNSTDPRTLGPTITSEDRVKRITAMRYLQEFRNGVARFVEARRASDVEVVHFPPDDKPANVRELMTFMIRHGYRFAEADLNDQRQYERLYDAMRDYCSNLYQMQASFQADEMNVDLTDKRIQDMLNIQLSQADVQGHKTMVENTRNAMLDVAKPQPAPASSASPSPNSPQGGKPGGAAPK